MQRMIIYVYNPSSLTKKFPQKYLTKLGQWFFLKDWLEHIVTIQVNLFQKHLFLHQLSHSMTKDCSLNYEFSSWKLQAQNILCQIECQNKNKKQFVYATCSEVLVFLYWSCNSINNLLSYGELVDARISAFDKDLPVPMYSAGPAVRHQSAGQQAK